MSRSTTSPSASVLPDPRDPAADELLERIDHRVLWLAVRMIHEANVVRPSVDGLKVGGHQASSASSVSIITELLLRYLNRGDVLAVKPHAGPAFHATQFLMGSLPPEYLTRLRAKNGLQPYLSRTKDPDPVDFSLGSMGLGPVSPLFAAATDGYLRNHFEEARSRPERKFVAMVGDAELDEGNIWEALEEESLLGLGNVTWIVDLNRQSLDRVIPGIRVGRTQATFAATGWQVLEAKYGRHLRARFAQPGGEVLRKRIDEMSNEEYQALLRIPGAEARERLIGGAAADDRDPLNRLTSDVDDAGLTALLADLGGHDHSELAKLLAMGDAATDRPTVIFAYTIKGWQLPFAGDAANHSALMTTDQITALAPSLGVSADDPWAPFPEDSAEGRWAHARRVELYGEGTPERSSARGLALRHAIPAEVRLEARVAPKVSTQMAFGDVLTEAARHPSLAGRLVTTSADVAVSTNLGGWINKVGVYDRHTRTIFDETPRLLKWHPNPSGQHIELGISEMNLFMMLGSLGLSAELLGEPLIPIGTVYDTFIARGLDALTFSLYNESRFILAATPSGVSLAPEGGAHQSTITPSLGIELPNLHAYEPAFAREVAWCLEEGIAGCVGERAGFSTYLRLTTRPVEQALAEPIKARVGEEEWRRLTLAGGYLLLSGREIDPSLPTDAPRVTVAAMGAIVPEAVEAVRFLVSEEVDANLVVVTSADRLQAEIAERRLASVRDGVPPRLEHLETLFPGAHRHAPIVTVLDGASHALSFLGGAFGAPVVPLGSDKFGQTGTIPDLYASMGFDTPHIVEAALLAAELRETA
ncbi:MAG: pyruvate dehydrogenase [Chloroflexota bacterium]